MSARPRWFAAALITVASIVLAHYAQVWTVVPSSLAPTSDFAGTYVAATLIRTGHAAQMYDPVIEQRALVQSGAPAGHDDIPFENPPGAAVVALPFSLLNAGAAWRAWSLLQLLLVALSLWMVARAAPWPAAMARLPRVAIALLALAGFGTGLVLLEGQWDGVSVVGLAIAYVAWRHGRPALAGFALGFTAAIAKPQLVIGIAAYMLGRRDWRGIAGALAGAAVTMVIGLLADGPHGLVAFVSAIATPHDSPTAEMQGSSGLFGSLLGQAPGVYFLSIGAGLAAAVVAGWLGAITRRRADLFEPSLCAAVALSLFASPHLLGHDLTLLAPVLVGGLAWLAGRPTEAAWPGPNTLLAIAGWALLSVATMTDLAQSTVGLPGRATPWALLLVAALWCALTMTALRAGAARPAFERRSAVA
ncbi:MAG TPA: glycosyltransferase family 87 protein [Candidatus Saccharimonadales bacterium]|nr:glycosyltransferase family 87 protein [Candidatus Saccharimonadales bacterium]